MTSQTLEDFNQKLSMDVSLDSEVYITPEIYASERMDHPILKNIEVEVAFLGTTKRNG